MKIAALLLLLTACQTAPRPGREAECTVFGHGPYDLNAGQCLQLAERQAYTNCALAKKDSSVDFKSVVFDNDKSQTKTGTCHSSFNSETQDCGQANCTGF